MSKLLPPERSQAERARTVARAAGAAAALVLLTLLSMQLASRLLDGAPGEATADEETPEAPPPPLEERAEVGLRVTSVEPVRLRVDLDGVEVFDGLTCTGGEGCEGPTLDFPLARVTTVELADLTRAKVIYKGQRVQPLGNLSVGRTLVFIDDTRGD